MLRWQKGFQPSCAKRARTLASGERVCFIGRNDSRDRNEESFDFRFLGTFAFEPGGCTSTASS
jgi:hypothetical protein